MSDNELTSIQERIRQLESELGSSASDFGKPSPRSTPAPMDTSEEGLFSKIQSGAKDLSSGAVEGMLDPFGGLGTAIAGGAITTQGARVAGQGISSLLKALKLPASQGARTASRYAGSVATDQAVMQGESSLLDSALGGAVDTAALKTTDDLLPYRMKQELPEMERLILNKPEGVKYGQSEVNNINTALEATFRRPENTFAALLGANTETGEVVAKDLLEYFPQIQKMKVFDLPLVREATSGEMRPIRSIEEISPAVSELKSQYGRILDEALDHLGNETVDVRNTPQYKGLLESLYKTVDEKQQSEFLRPIAEKLNTSLGALRRTFEGEYLQGSTKTPKDLVKIYQDLNEYRRAIANEFNLAKRKASANGDVLNTQSLEYSIDAIKEAQDSVAGMLGDLGSKRGIRIAGQDGSEFFDEFNKSYRALSELQQAGERKTREISGDLSRAMNDFRNKGFRDDEGLGFNASTLRYENNNAGLLAELAKVATGESDKIDPILVRRLEANSMNPESFVQALRALTQPDPVAPKVPLPDTRIGRIGRAGQRAGLDATLSGLGRHGAQQAGLMQGPQEGQVQFSPFAPPAMPPQGMPGRPQFPRDPELISMNPQAIQAISSSLDPQMASLFLDGVRSKDPLRQRQAMNVAFQAVPDLFEESITGLRSEIRIGDNLVLTDPMEARMYKAQLVSHSKLMGKKSPNFNTYLAKQISALNDPSDMRVLPVPEQGNIGYREELKETPMKNHLEQFSNFEGAREYDY